MTNLVVKVSYILNMIVYEEDTMASCKNEKSGPDGYKT